MDLCKFIIVGRLNMVRKINDMSAFFNIKVNKNVNKRQLLFRFILLVLHTLDIEIFRISPHPRPQSTLQQELQTKRK